MRIFLALLVSCSSPQEDGLRLVCEDVSHTCMGDIHEKYYATSEALPTATESDDDVTVEVYDPESASEWFHQSCALHEGERAIIQVSRVTR